MTTISRKNYLPALSLLAAGIMAGNVALAQESRATSYTLEEITVTARKVKENLQDVPISITAFTSEDLERRQINSSKDIGKITPNLQFSNNAPLAGNNNSSIIFIRGVGQISARANTDPGVGLYIDDVYMGQSVGGTMELRDISGVEVLRGPQGTLFGRNTIGGAVLISTTAPGDEFGGEIKLGVGEDNLYQAFGAVDIPISDTLKSRFSLGSKKQDGYVTRLVDGTDLGDVNNWTFMGKLLFEPIDTFTARLNYDYTKSDENGSPLVFAGYNNNTDPTASAVPIANPAWFGANQSVGAGCLDAWVKQPGPPIIETAPGSTVDTPTLIGGGPPLGYTGENTDPTCANNQWNAGPHATQGTYPVESKMTNWGLSLNMEWELNENFTLKSISSYRELSWTGKRDADNTPFTILHTDFNSDGDQFSQEIQLNYVSDRLTNVAGLYYYHEKIDDILSVQVGDKPAGFSCGPGTDRCHLDSDNNKTDNDSYAAFTQFTYDITDKLKGTFGVRYTEEHKASIPDQFDYLNPDDKYLPVQRYEADFSKTTFTANVSYNILETTMIYGGYADGFKGGGWNSTFNFPLNESDLDAGHQFDEEEVETWEIGFKSDVSDNLRVNGAIFTSDYTDLQFTYRVFIAPWFFNAGKASIDGAELEFTWLPTDKWIVEGGLGYLDSSIDEPVEIVVPGRPVNSGVKEGNELPFAPELTWNLGVSYIHEWGNYVISPRVDVSYSDELYFDASNTETIAQTDSYTTVDLSVSLESMESNWQFVLGVNNATDKDYRVSGNSSLGSGSGYAEAAYARPRVVFANLTYNF